MRRFFRWFLFITFLWICIFVAIGATALWSNMHVDNRTVLHWVLDGAISEAPKSELSELFTGEASLTLSEQTLLIRHAAKDERIAGLLLEIKNPELGGAQLQEITTALESFRSSGKKTYAFFETAGEFGGGDKNYALAAATDQIWLAPSGHVALSGFKITVPFVKGLLEKLHIEPFVDKRFEYKNAPNTFTDKKFSPEHKEATEALVNDLQNTLTNYIAIRRKLDPSVIKSWMAGKAWYGQAALENHVVDRVGYWDELTAAIEKDIGREDPFLFLQTYTHTRHSTIAPNIALVTGEGTIVSGDGNQGAGDGTMGSDVITQAFRDARQAGVKGVVFRINSPGGSYLASDMIRREVELTKQQGIPVVASFGDVAASGGYFVALGANSIVANPATITGSIGVFAVTFATRQFWENIFGITFDAYETEPKGMSLPWLDPLNADQKQALTESLDRIYKDFVEKTAAHRDRTPEQIHAVAKGRVWSGQAAFERGLVDEVGGLEVAIAKVKQLAKISADKDVDIVLFPQPPSPFETLLNILDQSARAQSTFVRFYQVLTSTKNWASKLMFWPGWVVTP